MCRLHWGWASVPVWLARMSRTGVARMGRAWEIYVRSQGRAWAKKDSRACM